MTISVVMLVWVMTHIIKNSTTCKIPCNLHELYTASKEKDPNVNIGFSKFCALTCKWCVLDGSKMTHSICVSCAHQNVVLLVDSMDWDMIDKGLIKKIVWNADSNKCIMHWCKFCLDTATLKEFFDQELDEHEDDKKFNYCQWDTADWATTFTATYEECKETLIGVIDDLTRYSYTTKLKLPVLDTGRYTKPPLE